MNENPLPAPDDQKIITSLALTQLWGFIGPGFNVLGPLVYRFFHKTDSPQVRKAFRTLMNLQISWSIYLLIPMIFVHGICKDLDLEGIRNNLQYHANPYMVDYVDPLTYIQPLLSVMMFLITELLITMIWVSITLKLVFEFKKGNISYRGILAIPFLR